MNKTTSVIIAGVGGQGTILAGRLLGNVAMDAGMDVKVSEVHGMAQRGGSVVTYVRYGDKVLSPVTGPGEADYLVSFELLEAARFTVMLRKGAVVICDSRKIPPAPVLIGNENYPEDIAGRISELGFRFYEIDALSIAEVAGFARAANIALMGAFAALSGFSYETWQKSLKAVIAERYYEQNSNAFAAGYERVRSL